MFKQRSDRPIEQHSLGTHTEDETPEPFTFTAEQCSLNKEPASVFDKIQTVAIPTPLPLSKDRMSISFGILLKQMDYIMSIVDGQRWRQG